MKILFTADLHIKLGQKGVPIDWYKNRFYMFLDQLDKMQDTADLLIIGGDIFDRLPTVEELSLYFDLVTKIKTKCIIYSGNHEATKKGQTFFSHLKKSTSQLNRLVTIVDDFTYIKEADLDIIPYNKLREAWPPATGKILCTHVRGAIPPHVTPEIDLELLNPWKLVLAGDLHSNSNSQRNILYPGSPYTTSFHRSEVTTGAIMLDTKTLKHSWLEFKLPQLLKMSVSVGEDTPSTGYHHTVYEVEGSLHELSEVESNDLVAKKVTQRDSETQLILSKELTLDEELVEYLRYIQNLSDEEVQDVMQVFHNNVERLSL